MRERGEHLCRKDSIGAQESWSIKEECELLISSQAAILFTCSQRLEQRVFSLVAILGFVTPRRWRGDEK